MLKTSRLVTDLPGAHSGKLNSLPECVLYLFNTLAKFGGLLLLVSVVNTFNAEVVVGA